MGSMEAFPILEEFLDTSHNDQQSNSSIVYVLEALDERIKKSNCKLIDFFPEFKESKLHGNEKLMPAIVFSRALIHLGLGISVRQAESLTEYLLAKGHQPREGGGISYKLIAQALNLYRKRKAAQQLHHFQDEDARRDLVFPNWLTERSDFQTLFPRFAGATADKEKQLLKALETRRFNRQNADFIIISEYIDNCPAFASMIAGGMRAVDIAKYIEYREMPKGEYLFKQGEVGDSFYIIFSGQVGIEVDGRRVAIFGQDQSFGEKSLENAAPRAASVKCLEPCSFVYMGRPDYFAIVSKERYTKIHFAVDLLGSSWPMGREWTHAKLYSLAVISHRMQFDKEQVVFNIGGEANLFFVVAVGRCAVRRLIRNQQVNRWPEGFGPDTVHERQSNKQVAVQLRTLSPGDHFGEDCLLGYQHRVYQVVALDNGTEVLAMNKGDMPRFFSKDEIDKMACEAKMLYISDDVLFQHYKQIVDSKKVISDLRDRSFGPQYKVRRNRRKKKATKRRNSSEIFDLNAHIQSIESLMGAGDNESVMSLTSQLTSLPSLHGSRSSSPWDCRSRASSRGSTTATERKHTLSNYHTFGTNQPLLSILSTYDLPPSLSKSASEPASPRHRIKPRPRTSAT